MTSFGIMVASPLVITIDGRSYPTVQYKNAKGKDLFDLAKEYPHPFYIAVDSENRVVSMTDDIEQTQIAGYEIVGIDSTYGETFGMGGSVYGKIWTGGGFNFPTEDLL